MADSREKTPAKQPERPQNPEAKAPERPTEEQPALVEPLNPQAFQMIMQIIDRADVKGSDAGNIVQLRLELARVANVQTRPRQ